MNSNSKLATVKYKENSNLFTYYKETEEENNNEGDREEDLKMKISYKSFALIINYLIFLFDSEVYLEKLKFSYYFSEEDFSPYKDFVNLRSHYYLNVINLDSLIEYFEKRGQKYYEVELCLLLTRFSVYKEAVSFEMFINGTEPLEIKECGEINKNNKKENN